MAYGYSEHKTGILKRLKRAEGQVRGVARMVETDTYCIDIMTQISAARAALDKVALELLRDHAAHCLVTEREQVRTEQVTELVGAVRRMLAR